MSLPEPPPKRQAEAILQPPRIQFSPGKRSRIADVDVKLDASLALRTIPDLPALPELDVREFDLDSDIVAREATEDSDADSVSGWLDAVVNRVEARKPESLEIRLPIPRGKAPKEDEAEKNEAEKKEAPKKDEAKKKTEPAKKDEVKTKTKPAKKNEAKEEGDTNDPPKEPEKKAEPKEQPFVAPLATLVEDRSQKLDRSLVRLQSAAKRRTGELYVPPPQPVRPIQPNQRTPAKPRKRKRAAVEPRIESDKPSNDKPVEQAEKKDQPSDDKTPLVGPSRWDSRYPGSKQPPEGRIASAKVITVNNAANEAKQEIAKAGSSGQDPKPTIRQQRKKMSRTSKRTQRAIKQRSRRGIGFARRRATAARRRGRQSRRQARRRGLSKRQLMLRQQRAQKAAIKQRFIAAIDEQIAILEMSKKDRQALLEQKAKLALETLESNIESQKKADIERAESECKRVQAELDGERKKAIETKNQKVAELDKLIKQKSSEAKQAARSAIAKTKQSGATEVARLRAEGRRAAAEITRRARAEAASLSRDPEKKASAAGKRAEGQRRAAAKKAEYERKVAAAKAKTTRAIEQHKQAEKKALDGLQKERESGREKLEEELLRWFDALDQQLHENDMRAYEAITLANEFYAAMLESQRVEHQREIKVLRFKLEKESEADRKKALEMLKKRRAEVIKQIDSATGDALKTLAVDIRSAMRKISETTNKATNGAWNIAQSLQARANQRSKLVAQRSAQAHRELKAVADRAIANFEVIRKSRTRRMSIRVEAVRWRADAKNDLEAKGYASQEKRLLGDTSEREERATRSGWKRTDNSFENERSEASEVAFIHRRRAIKQIEPITKENAGRKAAELADTIAGKNDTTKLMSLVSTKSPAELKLLFEAYPGGLDAFLEEVGSSEAAAIRQMLAAKSPAEVKAIGLKWAADGGGTNTAVQTAILDSMLPGENKAIDREFKKRNDGRSVVDMLGREESSIRKQIQIAKFNQNEDQVRALRAKQATEGGSLRKFADNIPGLREFAQTSLGRTIFGLGTDEAELLRIYNEIRKKHAGPYGSEEERRQAKAAEAAELARFNAAYKADTGRNLSDTLESELSGPELEAIQAAQKQDWSTYQANSIDYANRNYGDQRIVGEVMEGTERSERLKVQDKLRTQYKSSDDYIDDATLNPAEAEAQRELIESGELSDETKLYRALKGGWYGAGTDEEAVKRIFAGKSKAEIAELKVKYAALIARMKKKYPGQIVATGELMKDVGSEMGGNDYAQISEDEQYGGRPNNARDAAAKERKRRERIRGERPLGSDSLLKVGTGSTGEEYERRTESIEERFQRLRRVGLADVPFDELEDEIDRRAALGKLVDEDGNPVDAAELKKEVRGLRRDVGAANAWGKSTIKQQDIVVDTGAEYAGLAIGIVVGGAITFFSGGTLGPLAIGAISALAGGATMMTVKATMKGRLYDGESVAIDGLKTVVDAMTAGLAPKAVSKFSDHLIKRLGIEKAVAQRLLRELVETAGDGLSELSNALLDETLYDGPPSEVFERLAGRVAKKTGLSRLGANIGPQFRELAKRRTGFGPRGLAFIESMAAELIKSAPELANNPAELLKTVMSSTKTAAMVPNKQRKRASESLETKNTGRKTTKRVPPIEEGAVIAKPGELGATLRRVIRDRKQKVRSMQQGLDDAGRRRYVVVFADGERAVIVEGASKAGTLTKTDESQRKKLGTAPKQIGARHSSREVAEPGKLGVALRRVIRARKKKVQSMAPSIDKRGNRQTVIVFADGERVVVVERRKGESADSSPGLLTDGSNNKQQTALAIRETPAALYRYAVTASDGFVYIARGVASAESRKAVTGAGDGRKAGRENYGVKDKRVVPVFKLNDADNPMTSDDRYQILRDMQFYAQEGEAAQVASERGVKVSMRDASHLFPDATGDIIIYRVPVGVPLTPLPGSNVSRPDRVVALPKEASVWRVIAAPKDIDDDGFPREEAR